MRSNSIREGSASAHNKFRWVFVSARRIPRRNGTHSLSCHDTSLGQTTHDVKPSRAGPSIRSSAKGCAGPTPVEWQLRPPRDLPRLRITFAVSILPYVVKDFAATQPSGIFPSDSFRSPVVNLYLVLFAHHVLELVILPLHPANSSDMSSGTLRYLPGVFARSCSLQNSQGALKTFCGSL